MVKYVGPSAFLLVCVNMGGLLQPCQCQESHGRNLRGGVGVNRICKALGMVPGRWCVLVAAICHYCFAYCCCNSKFLPSRFWSSCQGAMHVHRYSAVMDIKGTVKTGTTQITWVREGFLEEVMTQPCLKGHVQ